MPRRCIPIITRDQSAQYRLVIVPAVCAGITTLTAGSVSVTGIVVDGGPHRYLHAPASRNRSLGEHLGAGRTRGKHLQAGHGREPG